MTATDHTYTETLEARLDEIRRLLGTGYLGPQTVLINRMTYDRIMELA